MSPPRPLDSDTAGNLAKKPRLSSTEKTTAKKKTAKKKTSKGPTKKNKKGKTHVQYCRRPTHECQSRASDVHLSTASKRADIKTMRLFIPWVYFFVTVITDYIFIF